jgi:hypothetical protein
MISYEFMDNSYGEILRSPLGRPWLSCLLEHVLFHLASQPTLSLLCLFLNIKVFCTRKDRSSQSLWHLVKELLCLARRKKKSKEDNKSEETKKFTVNLLEEH